MTNKLMLIIVAFGTILISCNSNTRQKNDITKAQKLELEQIRQDSIEATLIKGYSVKKFSRRQKYGGKTKIEYQSLPQLLDEVRILSLKQMWTKEKLQTTLNTYKNTCKGGQVRLYIERITIGAANTDMFSIIIKDTSESELYRVDLDNDIPEYSSDWWWNYGYAYINKRIKIPFYVYVVDKLEDTPFKFKVTAIKK